MIFCLYWYSAAEDWMIIHNAIFHVNGPIMKRLIAPWMVRLVIFLSLYLVNKLHQYIHKTFRRSYYWLSSWSKPIAENFKVTWSAQNWPIMNMLYSNLLHGAVHHPREFQADILNTQIVRALAPSLRQGLSLSWEFQSSGRHRNWPSIANLKSDLLHGTVHHPIKYQTNSWNSCSGKVVPQTWSKPIMENVKVPRNAKIWPSTG